MTFSIVAWDPDAPEGAEWGVAVASKFLAAGSVVPWARAGAGAVATQALANVTYGPRGLELLEGGTPASEVVEALTSADDGRDHRQLAVVDAGGHAATYTGSECLDWAGGLTGDGFACQGNILTGPEVVDAMVEAFKSEDGDLPNRLLAALLAGDRAGGDSRGKQAAGIFVVREGGGYLGDSDVAVDLRVDDHEDPVPELQRLSAIHRLVFPRPSELTLVEMNDSVAREVRFLLGGLGFDLGSGEGYDGAVKKALLDFVGTENLEARWTDDAAIEQGVMDMLRLAGGRSRE
jgi:uncharacterized Ntn-hydrolase superfamily protein